jgi:ABC-2 type transport system ATP-binding protein
MKGADSVARGSSSAPSSGAGPVVSVRTARSDARGSGRARTTGLSAGASAVVEAPQADGASVVVATGPRSARGGSRSRAAKAAEAASGRAAAAPADTQTSATTTGGVPAAAAVGDEVSTTTKPAKKTRQTRTAGTAPAASVAVPPVDDTAPAIVTSDEPASPESVPPRAASPDASSGEEVDTGPMPAHSAPVDEKTGSRQRITLFGRRRRGAAAAAGTATADPASDETGSELLAELVRETQTEHADDQTGALAPAPASTPTSDDVVPEWVVEQVYESDERDAELASLEVEDARPANAERVVAEDSAVDRGLEAAAPARARRAAETRAFPPARPAPPDSAPVVLAVTGLHKRYGDVVAVDGVHLAVRAGSLYGIVGPNGAGKTTTLSIITGLLRPDSGSVFVNGVDARKRSRDAKRAIGVLPDHLRTFDRLTGAQLLFYAGTLRGLDASTTRQRSADLAAAFGIDDAMGRLVADYSAGMTKKVSLAAAMIHSPRLLVLDEPFEGVDPVSAATVTGILKRYVDAGGTVLLSSHSMDLVQRICDSVAIIVGGVVLDSGPVDEVRGEKTLEDHFIELAGGRKAVEGLEWLHSFSD